MRALAWEDVDFDRRVRHVRRSRSGPRKNGRAYEVPLLTPAIEALDEWRQERQSRWSADRLVWPAHDGGMHALGYDAGLPRALERAGIKRHIRFHDLRHTCASLRLEEVKAWLDHSDIGVTQRSRIWLPTPSAARSLLL